MIKKNSHYRRWLYTVHLLNGKGVKKSIRRFVPLLFLFLPLLLANTSMQKNKTFIAAQNNQDTLATYIDNLFDYVDTNPHVIINGDDSLINTIWRAPQTADEKLSYYNLLVNIAYHFLQKRQIPSSIKWYEKAYRFYEAHQYDSILAPEMLFEEYVAKPLGNNYTRMGDFSKAMYIQQQAIQSASQKQLNDLLPGLYGNLATTYFHAQQFDSVQHYIDTGLQYTPLSHPQILNLFNLKAEAFLETAQLGNAIAWNNRAMQAAQSFFDANIDAIVITYLDKARILNHLKAHQQALKYLAEAWQMSPQQKIAEKVEIAIETGNAWLMAGNTDSSKLWHQTALEFFNLNERGLYPDFKVTTALFGIATAFINSNPDSAALWYEKAVLNDYYTQQLLPSSLNSRTAIYANKKYSEVAIALHHQLFAQKHDNRYLLKALWLAELSKGRQLLSEQERSRGWETDSTLIKSKALSDELKSLYLNLAETSDEQARYRLKEKIAGLEFELNLQENAYEKILSVPAFSDFENWIKEKSKRSALLSYYWGESYVYGVGITGNQYHHFLDTAVAESGRNLSAFVSRYFHQGPDAFNNDPGQYHQQSHAQLQKWFPWYAAGVDHVSISADGPLHALPFEALNLSNKAPQYLGENSAVTYSFSFLQQLHQGASGHKKAAISVYTLPQAHLGFSALPESENEQRFLSSKFKTNVFNAADAGTEPFIRSLQSGHIIHFASHAVAADSLRNNFLVLKEKLYLGQLQYATANCPLVVLAACETGGGQLQQGEGMESLGRALISKGVEGVIATRWPVDDKAASEIIRLFYKHLKTIKQPAEALQHARQEYIRANQSIAAKNPWLWAAFTFQGIDKSIEPASKNQWWLLMAGLCLIVVAYLFQKRPKQR